MAICEDGIPIQNILKQSSKQILMSIATDDNFDKEYKV